MYSSRGNASGYTVAGPQDAGTLTPVGAIHHVTLQGEQLWNHPQIGDW